MFNYNIRPHRPQLLTCGNSGGQNGLGQNRSEQSPLRVRTVVNCKDACQFNRCACVLKRRGVRGLRCRVRTKLIFDSGAMIRPAVFRRTPSGVSRTSRRSAENSISFSCSSPDAVALVIRGTVQCGQISRRWNVISPSVIVECGFEWSGKRTVILAGARCPIQRPVECVTLPRARDLFRSPICLG